MWIVLCKFPLLLETPLDRVCSPGWLEAGRVSQLAAVQALTPFSLGPVVLSVICQLNTDKNSEERTEFKGWPIFHFNVEDIAFLSCLFLA